MPQPSTHSFVSATNPTPADLLSLGLGGGEEAGDLETEFDLGAFLCACPELELYGCLGRGGMGIVMRARQVRLDRDVAVKLMNPTLSADPEFAERFEREAKALARLDHPGIVGVHDFGFAAGVYYLVMELVDGPNLRELIDVGMEDEQAIEVLRQLCDALAYAHDEGVVHRDIKPENVLLDRRGRVRVADFGLAKLQQENPTERTRTRRVMGTLHYMAPEQMRDPAGVDSRCDIFALGVVSYEMLTGQLPVGRFPAPSEMGRGNAALDEIVMRALESDRERRFSAVSDLQAALSSMSDPTTIGIETPSRSWWWLGLAVAMAVAVPMVFLLSGSPDEPETATEPSTPATVAEAEPTAPDEPEPEPDAAEAGTGATDAARLNRWPARELAALDPEVVGVVGVDWAELRQAPLVSRISETVLADQNDDLEPCVQSMVEHSYKLVAAFSAETVRELVLHGNWSAEALKPCLDAAGPKKVETSTLEGAADTDAVFHRVELEDEHGDEEFSVLSIAYDAQTMVLSFRPEITTGELAAKLQGVATSTEFRDQVISTLDLRSPVWGYGRPPAGVLPLDMISVHGGVELWDELGVDAAATFADEAAAIKGEKLADSYATIVSTVPDLPALSKIDVSREGKTVHVRATATLDDAALENLRLGDSERRTRWEKLGGGHGRSVEVHVGHAEPE